MENILSNKCSYGDWPTQIIFQLDIKPQNQFHSMHPFLLFNSMEKQDFFLFSIFNSNISQNPPIRQHKYFKIIECTEITVSQALGHLFDF